MAECPTCEFYKKLYESKRSQCQRLRDEIKDASAVVERERAWAGQATEYAITAMQSNVAVIEASRAEGTDV